MSDERLIEVLIPSSEEEAVRRVVADCDVRWSWNQSADGNTIFKLAVPAHRVEGILDPLEPVLDRIENARLVVLSVEAILPRRSRLDSEEAAENGGRETPSERGRRRLSREELYNDVKSWGQLSSEFLLMTLLSTVVAAVGLAKDNAVVVIAAMVIAPLLGPNMALALATTLGDRELILRSLRTGVLGIAATTLIAILATLLLPISLEHHEIASRTSVDLADICLGLAAGAAGALAITSGVASSLVGVMVAVALLPPLVVTAGLLTQGEAALAAGAGLLLVANLASVNLSALVVFFARGVRPRGWWDSRRSSRMVTVSLVLWVLLLVAVIIVVLRLQTR